MTVQIVHLIVLSPREGGLHLWLCDNYKDLPSRFFCHIQIQQLITSVKSKCFKMWWKTISPQSPKIGLLTWQWCGKNCLCMVGHNYWIQIFNPLVRANEPMWKYAFETFIMHVKGQCFVVTKCSSMNWINNF
jgi:hypothetical protein